jgi:AcrR family transcriptional regulator
MARPRSASAHEKVLQAALSLMAERGIESTSMGAIAEASGVSKATIYNHWTDKEALLLEVMADLHGLHARPTFDSGNTRRDMVDVLAYQPPKVRANMQERIMPHLIAYSARNPAFGVAWRRMVLEPPRRELANLIARGIRKGELTPGLETELCLALLLGPVLYQHIFRKNEPIILGDLPDRVVDAFWKAFQTQAPQGRATVSKVKVVRSRADARLTP